MELRANAGGDNNLFSTERKIRKQKLKIEEQSKKQYDRDQQQSQTNVFDFINETLSNQRKISFILFYTYRINSNSCQ